LIQIRVKNWERIMELLCKKNDCTRIYINCDILGVSVGHMVVKEENIGMSTMTFGAEMDIERE
jgi:hypothetical protein